MCLARVPCHLLLPFFSFENGVPKWHKIRKFKLAKFLKIYCFINFPFWWYQGSIRGHKSQNSIGTRCRGFLALESQCLVFLVLKSWCRGFLSSEKRLGITMSWLICLRFSMSWFFGLGILMSWFFGLGISMSWFFGLGISMSWLFGLGISMSWYMCLHGLVFVFTKSIMLHN